jgi:WD40 repeat protein
LGDSRSSSEQRVAPGTDEQSHLDTSALPTLSTASSPAGTPAYMAPEQTLPTAQFIGPWTDVYLLGGCLYCILVGTGPYGDSPSHEAFLRASEAIIRDPREVMPDLDIPDELAELALNALQREPRDRVASAAEFVKKLEDWISGASRRRESEQLSDEIAEEIGAAARTKYSEYVVGILSRIQEAAGLWTGNPALPPLRTRTTHRVRRVGADKGGPSPGADGSRTPPAFPLQRDALLQRVLVAREQRARTRRYLKVAGVVVSLLVVILIVGGTISNRVVNRALEESMRQTESATVARDLAQVARTDAERAREVAQSEQIYAQIRYATSLVEAGRHDMARSVLWSIPESARDWEWAYLISRAYQPLAEFPFQATDVSKDGEWIFVDDKSGTLQVRDTMAGALVASLDHQTTNVLVLPSQRDTHVDTLDGGRRLLRWSPPDWKPEVLAEFPSPVVIAKRVFGTDDLLVGFKDRAVAILDGGSGAERLRVPPIQDDLVAIDAYPAEDVLAVAGANVLAVYSISTQSQLRHLDTPFKLSGMGIIDSGKQILLHESLHPYIYDVASGSLQMVHKFAGYDGFGASHPESAFFVRMPDFLHIDTVQIAGQFPVSDSTSAHVKFYDGWNVLFWGGGSGEAGLFEFLGSRFVAPLEGISSPILNMWAVEANIKKGTEEAAIERIFTATEDGKTQVWLGGPNKFIARLPGQWGSFRSDAKIAVSIGGSNGIVQDLDDETPPFLVGPAFTIYRSIRINESRGKIYTFGCAMDCDQKFGWEAFDIATRSQNRLVCAGKTPLEIPYRWTTSDDDSKVAIMWGEDSACEIWSADEGVITARIEPTGAATTGLFCTPWDTLYASDVSGVIREYSLSDGSLIRKIELGTAVWAMAYASKFETLFVSGDDSKWRIYKITKDGLEAGLTRPTNAGPAIMANFGSKGKTLLTRTLDGVLTLTELESGIEILRFKVDADVFSIRLNEEGTRIFGIGDDGLYVWDVLGREVARVPGVRDIGMNGRRLLLTQDTFMFARDLVIELPPHRIEELPGESNQSFEDRFQLYRQNEYRRWMIANEGAKVPWSLLLLSDLNRGTLADSGAEAQVHLDGLLSSIAPSITRLGAELIPLIQLQVRLNASLPDSKWVDLACNIFRNYRFVLFKDPVAKEIVRAVAPSALFNATLVAEDRAQYNDDNSVHQMIFSIRTLELMGHKEEATLLARRLMANSSVYEFEFKKYYVENIAHLVTPPVPPPPPELVPVGPRVDLSSWAVREMDRLASLGLDSEQRGVERQKILERENELKMEWVNSVAPLPDFDAMAAQFRRALPPPLPPETPMSEVFGDTLVDFERCLLGGQNLPEARESMAARFDASVAAVKAERETVK